MSWKDKKNRKNIFSDNPWNDTPYFDPFSEEWTRHGMVDTNDKFELEGSNSFKDRFILTKHYCFKWPEKI